MNDLSILIDQAIPSDFKGYYCLQTVDEYLVGEWPINDISNKRVLELRVFNEELEHKWFRGNIGKQFKYRLLKDDESTSKIYEEPIIKNQYITNCDLGEQVIIKYYVPKLDLSDDSTITAYVKDWRIAGFASTMISFRS